MAARSKDTRPYQQVNAPDQRDLDRNPPAKNTRASCVGQRQGPQGASDERHDGPGPATSDIDTAFVISGAAVVMLCVMLCAGAAVVTLAPVLADVVAGAVELATHEPCATRKGASPAATMRRILAPNMAAGCAHEPRAD